MRYYTVSAINEETGNVLTNNEMYRTKEEARLAIGRQDSYLNYLAIADIYHYVIDEHEL